MLLSTNARRRFQREDWHTGDLVWRFDTAEYFGDGSVALEATMSQTTKKVFELGLKADKVTLAFWRKVLRSPYTTKKGLRLAITNIQRICKGIEVSAERDIVYFRKKTIVVGTSDALKAVKMHAADRPDKFVGIVCTLRKHDISPREIHSSWAELKRLIRKSRVYSMEHSLRCFRSNKRGYNVDHKTVRGLRRSMRRFHISHKELGTSSKELNQLETNYMY